MVGNQRRLMNRRQAIKASAFALSAAGAGAFKSVTSASQVSAQEQAVFGALSSEPLLSFDVGALNVQPSNVTILKGSGRNLALSSATGRPPAESELSNQFIVFQTALVDGSSKLLEPSRVTPTVETPEANPDVMLGVTLQ